MAEEPNCVKKIAENFNRPSRVHGRYRQTDDGMVMTYSEQVG